MANRILDSKIVLRNDTKANWNSDAGKAVVLLKGEVGFEIDTKKWKIGDGITTWANLPYQGSSISVAAEAPANPQIGDAWYDSTNKFLKIYDGTAWALAIPVPEYRISVAAKAEGGATINLNKDNVVVGTANIIAGANSTVSVDDNDNIVVAAKDTTYDISAAVANGVATITLTDKLDNSKSSTVKIGQDDNITLAIEGDVIKIKAVDTVYTIGAVEENDIVKVVLTDNKDNPSSQDVVFRPYDNNVSISLNDDDDVIIGINTKSTIIDDSDNTEEDTTIANIGAIKKYVKGVIAASDAMVFRGTIGEENKNPTVTKLPDGAVVGDTYKVVSDGTYDGLVAHVGDIIIYTEDRWVLVPSGDDGNVYHADELTNGQVVVGAGTASIKTLPAGNNGQILRMKDGVAAWTDETAESQLTVGTPETDTAAGTSVVTDIDVDGHEITPKTKNILGKGDISVTNENDGINVSITYTRDKIVAALNNGEDTLILNGGSASTVL